MIEVNAKGKVFTEVVTKKSVAAAVQTTTHLLRGIIHVQPDQRFKDELDRDEPFLAMTDVQVIGADGVVVYQTDFIAVQRSQIIWAMPVEEASK